MTEGQLYAMSDHIARFWHLLATEHVRILIGIRKEHDGYAEGDVKYHWDSASFSDDVAKALVASVRTRDALIEQCAKIADADRLAALRHSQGRPEGRS